MAKDKFDPTTGDPAQMETLARKYADIITKDLHPMMDSWIGVSGIPVVHIGGLLLGVALGAAIEGGLPEENVIMLVKATYAKSRTP